MEWAAFDYLSRKRINTFGVGYDSDETPLVISSAILFRLDDELES